MAVIGIVGPIGSGCSTITNLISEKLSYQAYSLSGLLRQFIAKEPKGKIPDPPHDRDYLQNKGNEYRQKNGSAFLAEKVVEQIKNEGNDTSSDTRKVVIRGIRNVREIDCLRHTYPDFFLIGIFADQEQRWTRTKDKYKNDRRIFENEDKRDSGEDEDTEYGQQVTAAFKRADIILLNNTEIPVGEDHMFANSRNDHYKDLFARLENYISYIETPGTFQPNEMENYMTVAYALSLRSSCLKRKVGAIIVDEGGSIFSSGYNEVPPEQETCLQKEGCCHRDKLKDDLAEDIIKKFKTTLDNNQTIEIKNEVKKNYKLLDFCRALHAEENAILNVAKIGCSSALKTATLYSSTYPCTLCANKIAAVGIKKMIYFEPYPSSDAKEILKKKKVETIPFQGVTYNGYFKLMEVID